MSKVLRKIRSWSSGAGSLKVLAVGLVGGLIIFASAGTFMTYANSENFCTNACHEMTSTVAVEYKGTIHDTNRTGVRATCNDCHVPHGYITNYLAKLGLFNDYWGHFVTGSINTKEKFEAKRPELAKRVWVNMKSNDSRECRRCHTAAKMDPERQTDKAKVRHEKGRNQGLTCIECHFAISHQEPEGPGPQELFADKATDAAK